MDDRKPTTAEPREAALTQVERDTAGQQERTQRFAERERHEAGRTSDGEDDAATAAPREGD